MPKYPFCAPPHPTPSRAPIRSLHYCWPVAYPVCCRSSCQRRLQLWTVRAPGTPNSVCPAWAVAAAGPDNASASQAVLRRVSWSIPAAAAVAAADKRPGKTADTTTGTARPPVPLAQSPRRSFFSAWTRTAAVRRSPRSSAPRPLSRFASFPFCSAMTMTTTTTTSADRISPARTSWASRWNRGRAARTSSWSGTAASRPTGGWSNRRFGNPLESLVPFQTWRQSAKSKQTVYRQ